MIPDRVSTIATNFTLTRSNPNAKAHNSENIGPADLTMVSRLTDMYRYAASTKCQSRGLRGVRAAPWFDSTISKAVPNPIGTIEVM